MRLFHDQLVAVNEYKIGECRWDYSTPETPVRLRPGQRGNADWSVV